MTTISTLGQALDQIERIKDQQSLFTTLSSQLTTGKKTQQFSGLKNDVLTSQRSRADFKTLETYVNNIKNADRRVNLMLGAVKEFKQQAENFLNILTGLNQQSAHQEGEVIYYDDPGTPGEENFQIGMTSSTPDVDLRTLQDFADNIFDFFLSAMNEKDGDRFLFSGAETLTQPISDTGTLEAAINGLISDWKGGAITTTDLINDLQERTTSGGNNDALTDTIVGYSSVISSGNVKDIFVRMDENSEIDYTIMANESAFRDVIVAAAYFKNGNLPPIADELDPNTLALVTQGAPGSDLGQMKDNFYEVFNELTRMVTAAVDNIEQLQNKLENVKLRITNARDAHVTQQNLLQNTIDDVENIDPSEVAVRINALQLQLEASFRVTALTSQLTLVNFI